MAAAETMELLEAAERTPMSHTSPAGPSLVQALQAVLPQRSQRELEPAAAWLGEKFGITLAEDVDGACVWANAALEVLAMDTSIGPDHRTCLQELLQKMTDPEVTETSGPADVSAVSKSADEEEESVASALARCRSVEDKFWNEWPKGGFATRCRCA